MAEPRKVGVKYGLDHWSDRWVIRHHADGAVDFQLSTSTAEIPAKATWTDWVAHTPGRYITGFSAYAQHLVRLQRVNAIDQIVVMGRDGREHEIGRASCRERVSKQV